MITDLLALQFGYNFRSLQANTAGIGHDDSLVQPQPGGNCLNWILGHVVATRSGSLGPPLGLEPFWSEDEAAPYRRKGPPLTDAAKALPFDKIQADLEASQGRLEAALAALTEAQLAAPSPFGGGKQDQTVASLLALLAFHEAYHAGQTGILRRLLGRPGAIT